MSADPAHPSFQTLAKEGGRIVACKAWLGTGRDFLECTVHGAFGEEALASFLHRLRDDPQITSDMPILWDLREADRRFCAQQDCEELVQSVSHFSEGRGAKRACLVDSELGFGLARMFQEMLGCLAPASYEAMKVSYSRDDLLTWMAE